MSTAQDRRTLQWVIKTQNMIGTHLLSISDVWEVRCLRQSIQSSFLAQTVLYHYSTFTYQRNMSNVIYSVNITYLTPIKQIMYLLYRFSVMFCVWISIKRIVFSFLFLPCFYILLFYCLFYWFVLFSFKCMSMLSLCVVWVPFLCEIMYCKMTINDTEIIYITSPLLLITRRNYDNTAPNPDETNTCSKMRIIRMKGVHQLRGVWYMQAAVDRKC